MRKPLLVPTGSGLKDSSLASVGGFIQDSHLYFIAIVYYLRFQSDLKHFVARAHLWRNILSLVWMAHLERNTIVKGALHLLIGAHSESALFKFEKDALEDCLHAWWRAHSQKGLFLLIVISKYKKGPSLDH